MKQLLSPWETSGSARWKAGWQWLLSGRQNWTRSALGSQTYWEAEGACAWHYSPCICCLSQPAGQPASQALRGVRWLPLPSSGSTFGACIPSSRGRSNVEGTPGRWQEGQQASHIWHLADAQSQSNRSHAERGDRCGESDECWRSRPKPQVPAGSEMSQEDSRDSPRTHTRMVVTVKGHRAKPAKEMHASEVRGNWGPLEPPVRGSPLQEPVTTPVKRCLPRFRDPCPGLPSAQHIPEWQTPCRKAWSGKRIAYINYPGPARHREVEGSSPNPRAQAPVKGPLPDGLQEQLGRDCCQHSSAHSTPGLWRIRTPTLASLHITP